MDETNRLTNLRAECERAIELDTKATPGPLTLTEFGIEGPSNGLGESVIQAAFDGSVIISESDFAKLAHAWDHSARASRALLLLERAVQELSAKRACIIFAEEEEHVADFFRPLDNALAAIAAEFAGEEGK